MAASLVLALVAPWISGLESPRPPEQDPVWLKVAPAVATIENNGQATGVAVLIDDRGYFLAHRNNVPGIQMLARFGGDKPLILQLRSVDEQTQLALLQAFVWTRGRYAPVRVATSDPTEGSVMIAATPAGPIRGDFIAADRVGVMRPSLRYAPLSEIRFETTFDRVGGALVFDADARLVGVLGATLSPDSNGMLARTVPGAAGTTQGVAGGGTAAPAAANFGPQGMTVGYALSRDILSRVVDGFRTPNHIVQHPSIGVFFRAQGQQGALIEVVLPGSPAEAAGIRPGDLVTRAGEDEVRTPVDLAIVLFRQKVGATLELEFRRGDTIRTVEVKVGKQS